MSEIIEQARQKLADEEKNFQGGQMEKVVYHEVSKTLRSFCDDERFARAIAESGKTLSDCCKAIMTDVHSGISDFEVYKRAAIFYFPTATVQFKMEIRLEESEDKGKPSGNIISLLDLI